jgi:hypothetical protein
MEAPVVLLASNYDQSKWFKAADLQNEKKLRIKSATEELIGVGADQKKMLTIWFTNSEKGLPLNRINNRTIRGAFGDACTDWAGKIIVLYPTQADFRGRMVPCLRVRIPPPKQAGNGQTAATPPIDPDPELSGATATPLAEELNDDLPW